MTEVFEEQTLREGCYEFVSNNRGIRQAWKQETRKEYNSVKDEILLTLQTAQFEIRRKKTGQKNLSNQHRNI